MPDRSAYRMVALDLDGTTIGRDLTLHPAVPAAVAAARAAGIMVTIATGRMYGSTLPFARQLGIDAPLICYQGALIRHPGDGTTLAHWGMPAAAAAEAARDLIAAGICTIAYVGETLFAATHSPELDTYLGYHPDEVDIRIDPDLARVFATTPPTKLLFVAEPEVVDRELARLAPIFGDRLALLRSHTHFGELTALGVSKGAALARLAAQSGIAREHVLAIGDQENDLSMITWAGLG
ncbi:MAG TPA: HAD-IIB family hydrolase, partial [Roseiflexaceae bacterium]|nr:HAD-IIB family hydrolase [Roseiflexaceae bacterium]